MSLGNTFNYWCHYVERRRMRNDLPATESDQPQTRHRHSRRLSQRPIFDRSADWRGREAVRSSRVPEFIVTW